MKIKLYEGIYLKHKKSKNVIKIVRIKGNYAYNDFGNVMPVSFYENNMGNWFTEIKLYGTKIGRILYEKNKLFNTK